MYTLNIENANSIEDNKIIGGGQVFKVYNVSEFVNINIDPSTDMDSLCKYYFSYIVYDKLIDGEKNMYTLLKDKINKLKEFIIKKLLDNLDGSNNLIYTNNDINDFSQYISRLFSIKPNDTESQQNTSVVPRDDFFKKINLSQGQYLYHLDNIYQKYKTIYNIIENDKKKILTLHDTTVMSNEKKSFHDKIEYHYKLLQSIKDKNFFYKTNIFYIQDETILQNNSLKKNNLDKLLQEYGIEILIHIYYLYVNINDLKRDYKFEVDNLKRNIRIALARFICYDNYDIVNLLIFQDVLLYKILTNGSEIIYNNKDLSSPISNILEQNISNNTNNSSDMNIEVIKHELLYTFKELEKELRTYFLPNYNFTDKYYGDEELQKLGIYSAIDIINIRQDKLTILLQGVDSIIIEKIKQIIMFYKNNQLVKCKITKSNNDKPLEEYFIGKIVSLELEQKICKINLLVKIKDNSNFNNRINELIIQSTQLDNNDLKNKFEQLIEDISPQEQVNIPLNNIYDTNILLGEKMTNQKCNLPDQINYSDIDLFNREFDNDTTYASIWHKISDSSNVLFIKSGSLHSIHTKKTIIGLSSNKNIVDSNEIKYAYSLFDINNNELHYTNNTCSYLSACDIATIFEKPILTEKYDENMIKCLLIEKVNKDNFILPDRESGDIEYLDKLYFSNEDIDISNIINGNTNKDSIESSNSGLSNISEIKIYE